MKQQALLILLMVAGIAAFARQHKHKRSKAPVNHIISVSLRHTACYGRCPVYTIELNKDGMVTYTATLFNPDTGVFTKNIGAESAMRIINQFQMNRIDTCQDKYNSRMTDLPGTIFTIKYDSSTKTIIDAGSGPQVLKQLRATMDSLVTRKLDNTWTNTHQK